MNYCIKLGNMYLSDIIVDEENIKNDFIRIIEFRSFKDECQKVSEEEKEYYVEKISKVLGVCKNSITFEEVEEDE